MRFFFLSALLLGAGAGAQEPEVTEVPVVDEGDGYTPDEAVAEEPLRLTGYIDVGFAKATGNGSSFLGSDTRVPLDYGNDAFAPAVNSRGEVASTDTQGRFTNGFLPRSVGIGSAPSFLINTTSADVRFQPRGIPVFLFARLQLMPRLLPTGDQTRASSCSRPSAGCPRSRTTSWRSSWAASTRCSASSTWRTKPTCAPASRPSLIARYTTGHGLGAKAFYRFQLPAIWSAVSFNVAATNNGTRIEALVPVDASLTGNFVGSGRVGYELNLQRLQVKAGVSGLYGPRNDQRVATATQWAAAGDLRINAYGVSLAGEFLRLVDEPRTPGACDSQGDGPGPRRAGVGVRASGAAGAGCPTRCRVKTEVVTGVTVYGRYDRRHGQFEGFTEIQTDRFTVGARVDLWDMLASSSRRSSTRSASARPSVDNDVFTSSAVFTW